MGAINAWSTPASDSYRRRATNRTAGSPSFSMSKGTAGISWGPTREEVQRSECSACSQRLDQPAIDHEVCARDVPRAVAGQEEHQIGDFLRAGEAPRREPSL